MRRPLLSTLHSRPLCRPIQPPRHVPPIPRYRLCSSCPPPPLQSAAERPPDHRVIASAQQLLTTSPYSPGSPLFLPHGAHIYNKLVAFLRSQYARYGFHEVLSPDIYRRSLWETSGHWDIYKNDMFEVTGRGAVPVLDSDGMSEEYGLKPMNCPGHCLMFKSNGHSRSLRDLPVRYADFSPLHRNENSGSLSGLTRVRRFHQDDGHIFCRPSQVQSEISSTLSFITEVYRTFKLPTPTFALSTRPDNHIGNPETWARAEAALTQALDSSGQPWTLNAGDGAFYGPKIDVILTDPDGKLHQTATIQLDFHLPERFGLSYLAPAPKLEEQGIVTTDPEELKKSGYATPVLIHRAVLGSLERFMALLMEHYGGKWPFWLSPRQCIVLPVTNSDEVMEYARWVRKALSGIGPIGARDGFESGKVIPMSRQTFSVDIDESANSLAKKVKMARTAGYNFVAVVGRRNVEERTVSLDGKIGDGGADKMEYSPAMVYQLFKELEDKYE